ncbi:TPA: D-alanyl-lipoteichoic acid biosynthesis protein DltD, partial [Staphylococcus aureus]|nr:D-alanyl-lipoteichoic acid biosynthesis protein DltD [Staphylococcus aureus]
KKVTPADRYLARRLLTFSKVKENDTLTAILQTIKKGKLPLPESLNQLRSQWNMLKREDEVFSNIGLKDRQQKIDHESKRLPKQYQETELSILANQIGERETTNNPFGLKNDFYTHRIRAHETRR